MRYLQLLIILAALPILPFACGEEEIEPGANIAILNPGQGQSFATGDSIRIGFTINGHPNLYGYRTRLYTAIGDTLLSFDNPTFTQNFSLDTTVVNTVTSHTTGTFVIHAYLTPAAKRAEKHVTLEFHP